MSVRALASGVGVLVLGCRVSLAVPVRRRAMVVEALAVARAGPEILVAQGNTKN